jgi:FkbM family methyltransferase
VSAGSELRRKLRAGVARRRIQPLAERVHGWSLMALGIGGATRPLTANGESHFIASLAAASGGAPVTCLDVGANLGDYTQLLVDAFGPSATVHAFEPAADVHRATAGRFASVPGVTVHRTALGAVSGSLTLHSSEGRTQIASVYGFDCDDGPGAVSETVPVTTLDAWVASVGLGDVLLLKVDVEGAECDVLDGATDLLASGRVANVQFEYGAQNLRSGKRMQDILDRLGPDYRLHRMVVDGLVPVRPGSSLLELPVSATNYVAVRRA